MASAQRKAEKWEKFQARKAAMVYGAPAPADRERRLHDRYLAQRENDDQGV